jgi:2-methylcitrate dehydratase PrpD
MSGSAQQRLAAFVAEASSIPESARDIARQSLLDSIAVAFAGRDEAVHACMAAYLDVGRQRPDAALRWLDGTSLAPEQAALANAVAVHALDYDDVTPAWRGHPGTVLWPAIFALGASQRSYGDMLDAFVIGLEVGAQVGGAIVVHHYGGGWHATSTIGAIAGAAACSRLLGLDATRASHAIGLAVAQSAGVQGNFGTMAKPLQAGFAAAAAVRSALLARHGVEAGDVLEGRNGFSQLYGAAETLPLSLPEPSSDAIAILRAGIEVKQFPNCYATHRAVEAALSLRDELFIESTGDDGSGLSSIRSILIEGTPGAHKPLLTRRPTSVDESRFSVELAVAWALVDGALRQSSVAPGTLVRPPIRALGELWQARESAALGPRRAARVSIELADGEMLQSTVAELPGTYGDPVFMRRLKGKVADCMASVGLERFAAPLWTTVIATPSNSRIDLESSLLPAIWAETRGSA